MTARATAARPGSARRGTAREVAILDAALSVLAEVGYDRTSMDAIAARARASKATIYRHWPGKAELVVEAMRRRSCIEDDVASTDSLRGDLVSLVGAACCAMAGTDGVLLVGLLGASMRDPELAALLRASFHEDKRRMVAELVGRAVARRELPAGTDPCLVLDVLPGAVFMRVLVLGQPPTEDFVLRLVDDILLPLLTQRCPGTG